MKPLLLLLHFQVIEQVGPQVTVGVEAPHPLVDQVVERVDRGQE